ncbi:DUF6774 domain-containing protein [Pseudoflavonifractor intestinihominis]|uniref:DUF6774 domain-containing protein n=1 Tax=Pseudoflavonifractor intestinihominis TaxID=3133171 RepID=A0ABV1EC44_9FIRM|nr:DUF6774 domain-containing protein [uncultured Pseudoflavonifractor sp.]
MSKQQGSSGELLPVLASLVSVQLSRALPDQDLALTAAFFTALGDNLALIATGRSQPEQSQ